METPLAGGGWLLEAAISHGRAVDRAGPSRVRSPWAPLALHALPSPSGDSAVPRAGCWSIPVTPSPVPPAGARTPAAPQPAGPAPARESSRDPGRCGEEGDGVGWGGVSKAWAPATVFKASPALQDQGPRCARLPPCVPRGGSTRPRQRRGRKPRAAPGAAASLSGLSCRLRSRGRGARVGRVRGARGGGGDRCGERPAAAPPRAPGRGGPACRTPRPGRARRYSASRAH